MTARVLAVIGWGITVVLFLIQRQGRVWQGRLNSTKDLRPKFEEVRDVISSIEQAPGNAELLWTITAQGNVDALRDASQNCPDRKLRTLMGALVSEVDEVRGASQPTDEDTPTPTLSARRHAAVKRASAKADEIVTRLNQIQRKGATGG